MEQSKPVPKQCVVERAALEKDAKKEQVVLSFKKSPNSEKS